MSFLDTSAKITSPEAPQNEGEAHSKSCADTPRKGVQERAKPQEAVDFAVQYLEQRRQELGDHVARKAKSQREREDKQDEAAEAEELENIGDRTSEEQKLGQAISASEHVSSVFTPANFTGIRSLPNALSPYFRELLYEELVQAVRRVASAPGSPQESPRNCAARPEGNDKIHMETIGNIPDGRFCLSRGSFTTFPYNPSEYDQQRWLRRMDMLLCRVSWMSDEDFLVKSIPSALRASTAFSTFRHMDDPFEIRDDLKKNQIEHHRAQILFGPVKAGGKIRTKECLAGLSNQLSADWPEGFLQAFIDMPSGNFVVSFNCKKCSTQGDLLSYMNQLALSHIVVKEFNLRKDAHKWGLVDQETDTVFFVFVSPWGKYKPTAPVKSAQRCSRRNRPRQKKRNAIRPAMDAHRVPFGDRTDAGLLRTTCTRPFFHGFRY